MGTFITKLLALVKESPKYLFGILLGTAIFLFSGIKPIDSIREQYEPYFYIAFVFSACSLIAYFAFAAGAWVREKHLNFFGRSAIKKRIRNLTPKEKSILNRYIEKQTRSLSLNTADGTTTELINAGIIYPSTNWLDASFSDHNIVPWVWDYINKHPEYVIHNN